jgi:mannose-6-phosphate isomerase-like protein (cupin superfamily)
MTSEPITTIIDSRTIRRLDRGAGIETTPLVTRDSVPHARFTTGISSYPPETGAPLHRHNCDEQVVILSGCAEAEIGGRKVLLSPHDSTYIPAGVDHAFRNAGDAPLAILWIYASDNVTRVISATGTVVNHLSPADTLA